jgi:tetratricopeptide (TPR) repeat protein
MVEETPTPRATDAESLKDGAPRWMIVTALVLLLAVLVVGGMVIIRLPVGRPADVAVDPRIRVLEESVGKHPEDLVSRRLLAFAYQQTGLSRKALKQYDMVLSSDPRDLGSLYNSGLLHLELGQDQQGVRALKGVLALAPSHALAAKALAEYYAKTEAYDRIGGVVLAAVNAHPEMADLQFLAGLGYEKTGHADEAAACYRRALKLIPDMSDARTALDRLEGPK